MAEMSMLIAFNVLTVASVFVPSSSTACLRGSRLDFFTRSLVESVIFVICLERLSIELVRAVLTDSISPDKPNFSTICSEIAVIREPSSPICGFSVPSSSTMVCPSLSVWFLTCSDIRPARVLFNRSLTRIPTCVPTSAAISFDNIEIIVLLTRSRYSSLLIAHIPPST
ncbi:hypothetical protein ASN18_3250 [Candidatus Magnetominusculus xianensis]|uniref:Secreted protein n=1 Tax=Candidatus Magnetominusculus xianensis TaxID=1748249 RepID=A0ABR5SAW9_9BACT|nr:hypothetical protein ASN18_3250 [Candidatus Magnetominusculus xianensis]